MKTAERFHELSGIYMTHTIDRRRQRQMGLFEQVYRNGLYAGFSRGTPGQDRTPFLDDLVQRLGAGTGSGAYPQPLRVLELGPGEGYHSMALARNGFRVTAVESSPTAAAAMSHLCLAPGNRGLDITFIVEDLVAYLEAEARRIGDGRHGRPAVVAVYVDSRLTERVLQPGRPTRPSAVYAHSVFHLLSAPDRARAYAAAASLQPEGGFMAVTFKAHDDVLRAEGKVVAETPAGAIVRGNDGIERLFVSDPQPLIEELRTAGYAVNPEPVTTRNGIRQDITRFEIPGYNHPGRASSFVGIFGQKWPRPGNR